MVWTLYSAEDNLETYRDVWQKINDEANNSHPLLDPKFIFPLYEHFRTENVVLAVAEEEGKPVGIGLFENRGKGRWQLFFPSQAPVGPFILANQGQKSVQYLQELYSTLNGFVWQIDFLKQDPEYSVFFQNKNIQQAKLVSDSTTISVKTDTSFDDYWQARNRKLRRDLGRIIRKIERDGLDAKLVEVVGKEHMRDALIKHGELESAGWKAEAGTAIHIDNIQGGFYSAVLDSFSQGNNARVYQLYFGEKIVASLLTIMQNGMMVLLKTAHDESMAKYSPGRVLDYKMMELLFPLQEISTIEFYTNASKEDARWGTATRDVVHVNYYRSTIVKNILGLVKKVLG